MQKQLNYRGAFLFSGKLIVTICNKAAVSFLMRKTIQRSVQVNEKLIDWKTEKLFGTHRRLHLSRLLRVVPVSQRRCHPFPKLTDKQELSSFLKRFLSVCQNRIFRLEMDDN